MRLIIGDLERVLTCTGFLTEYWKNQLSRRRNPAHGFPVYRSLARSARIRGDRPNYQAPRVGIAPRTPKYVPRLSRLSGVLFSDQRGPRPMYPRSAHLGSAGHLAAAHQTL